MLITLLSDFGTADYFVGAMKGAILSINPKARIVDITHEIPLQNVRSGAFTLAVASQTFPKSTIHVAVVDPGVGSERRPILVAAGDQFFIGPDNGLFSYIYEREPDVSVFHVTNRTYFREPVSSTFHGRDVFAPVAATLSLGAAPKQFGVEIADYVRLDRLTPIRTGERTITAAIIHIDRFGNCITNLTPSHITEQLIEGGVRLTVNGREINSFRRFFAEEHDVPGELFAIWGSAGYLELAAFRASAARMLDAQTGDAITATVLE